MSGRRKLTAGNRQPRPAGNGKPVRFFTYGGANPPEYALDPVGKPGCGTQRDLDVANVAAAAERERIIGSDRASLQLMLESLDSLAPGPGPDAVACGRVVRRLLEGHTDE